VQKREFWDAVIRGLEAEPREPRDVHGISGLVHPVLGIGVDDKRGRLILVSSEHDARTAAMMQADVQATVDHHVNVLVARPVVINLSSVAQTLIEQFGDPVLSAEQFQRISEQPIADALNRVVGPMRAAFEAASPNLLAQVIHCIQQLALIDFKGARLDESDSGQQGAPWSFGLTELAEADPTRLDRTLGVCGLPLYDLTEDEIEAIKSSSSAEDIAETLSRLGVRQYFFPAPDQAALGLIDRGVKGVDRVVADVTGAPEIGHPLGISEIIPPEARGVEMIEALEHQGYVVTGEFGLEVTDSGSAQRMTVRFQPREGLISKLINRLNINLDLKNLLGN